MFDLFRSREKKVRWFLGTILGLVAVSMVVTLVPSYGGMGGPRDQNTIAEIGDETLTATEVRQALSRAMRNGNIPRGMEEGYAPELIQEMIAERAISYEAARLGLTVSEAELASAIELSLPQLFEGGKFAGKEAYQAFLERNNLTIPEFESNLKRQLLLMRLQSLTLQGIAVSQAQVEKEFRERNEKIKVSYFQLSLDKLRAQISATPDELQKYFGLHRASYMIPEMHDYLAFSVEQDKIAAGIQVTDADLQRAYNEQRERFRVPERVRVRHVLLKTAGKNPADTAAARKKIEDLLKQVKSGAKFADIAAKNSEDTGSAVQGGEIGWITRGQTVPEFEQAAFSLPAGQISGIIQTTYGFHFLEVEGKEMPHIRTLDEVKEELVAVVRQARSVEKMQAIAEQIRAALVRSAAEAEKVAAANGITPVRASKVHAGATIPGVGGGPALAEALTGLKKAGVTPVISLSNTSLAVVQLLETYPSRQADLAEVQDQVKNAYVGQELQKLILARGQEIDSALKAGADFATLAKKYGAEVKSPAAEVGREGAIEGLGPAAMIVRAFDKKVGETAGPFELQSGITFVKVTGRIDADMTKLAAQREDIVNAVKMRQARERRDLLADGLVASLVKKKKIKIFDDNIKRLVAAYHS